MLDTRRSSPAFSIGGVSYLDWAGELSEIVPPPGGWACFSCGERFYTVRSALKHFGPPGNADRPKCERVI
jgi:hypothetical protein